MSAPVRIQRKRTTGWRMPEGARFVGRGTAFGNPFILGKTQVRTPGVHGEWEYEGRLHKVVGEKTYFSLGCDDAGLPIGFWHEVQLATREQVVELFRRYLLGTGTQRLGTPPSLDRIRAELGGKDLACWCPLTDEQGAPVPCHADVLLEVANEEMR